MGPEPEKLRSGVGRVWSAIMIAGWPADGACACGVDACGGGGGATGIAIFAVEADAPRIASTVPDMPFDTLGDADVGRMEEVVENAEDAGEEAGATEGRVSCRIAIVPVADAVCVVRAISVAPDIPFDTLGAADVGRAENSAGDVGTDMEEVGVAGARISCRAVTALVADAARKVR